MNLSIVLPKGRLLDKSLRCLSKANLELEVKENRNLVQKINDNKLVISKPKDVPVHVEHGIDIGISGSDVLEERKCDVFVPLELDFGKCRLSIAVPEKEEAGLNDLEGCTIATEYPNLAKEYFEAENISVDILRLNGSIEVAPRIGIADAIVDIVQTGRTLQANGLVELEKIMDVSALLMINRISQKVKFEEINKLIDDLKEVD